MEKISVVSFIGVGQKDSKGSPSGYRETEYLFPDKRIIKSSIFGIALCDWLSGREDKIARWLIMGTKQSVWPALYDLVKGEKSERLTDDWLNISQKHENGELGDKDLKNWATILENESGCGFKINLIITGPGEDEQSQQTIIDAIFNAAEDTDILEMDITHGFRHQPVIASFAVILLRHSHKIKTVNFRNGCYELREGENSPAPVVTLDICNTALKVDEALATYAATGEYEQFIEVLPSLSEGSKERVKNISLSDETNQPINKDIKRLRTELVGLPERYSWEKAVKRDLIASIEFAQESNLDERMFRKAERAFANKQYMKCTLLLFEALLQKYARVFSLQNCNDPRAEACNMLKIASSSCFEGEDHALFNEFQHFRNVVVHSGKPNTEMVAKAISNTINIEEFLYKAFALFDKIKK